MAFLFIFSYGTRVWASLISKPQILFDVDVDVPSHVEPCMDILRQVFIDSFTQGTQNVSKVKQLRSKGRQFHEWCMNIFTCSCPDLTVYISNTACVFWEAGTAYPSRAPVLTPPPGVCGVCVPHNFCFLCCPIMCLYVLSSVFWCPLRFAHKNDDRLPVRWIVFFLLPLRYYLTFILWVRGFQLSTPVLPAFIYVLYHSSAGNQNSRRKPSTFRK